MSMSAGVEQVSTPPLAVARGSPGVTGIAIALVAALALLAHWFTKASAGWFGREVIEYPVWAVAVGLTANLLLGLTALRSKLSPGFRTELFLKTGLVIMGATINFATVAEYGLRGLGQAVVMISAVFFFTWWFAGLLGIQGKLRALMASALSICGVSAAIAAAGAVAARKEELGYVTTLVILFALPLMFLQPFLARTLDIPAPVAGAWIGGNIDTTAAVVGAGALVGEETMQVASIVKMSQNALIGFAAFFLAVYWVFGVERAGRANKGEASAAARVTAGTGTAVTPPQTRQLWQRFPKFVLGFMVASFVATAALTAGWASQAGLAALGPLRNWFLTMAFVSIGLEVSPKGFLKLGWRPVAVYAVATFFNMALALGVAWLIFG